ANDLIDFQSVSQVPRTPVSGTSTNFQAMLWSQRLQVQGATADLSHPVTLTSADGWVPLFRVYYTISPSAPVGDVIAVNF
ncbi:MAG: hypothetical protein KDA92_25785, partial [Planctomycetales bacterium]|nr:hypothetical protein [Planctomycetales bacterium]